MALYKAKDSGLKIALATANGLDFALNIARYLGVVDVIAENGCILSVGGEVLELCNRSAREVDDLVLRTNLVEPSHQNRCRKYDLAYKPLSDPNNVVEALRELVGRDFVVEDSGYAIHIRPKGVDKGTALAKLCEKWGIPCELVAVIGDSDVDVPMLSAGWGIAVGNASYNAKKAARLTVSNPSGLGFAQAVDLILDGLACL